MNYVVGVNERSQHRCSFKQEGYRLLNENKTHYVSIVGFYRQSLLWCLLAITPQSLLKGYEGRQSDRNGT